jgi:hypothetical protein
MNSERINELEKFADDFNKKLEDAFANYEEVNIFNVDFLKVTRKTKK